MIFMPSKKNKISLWYLLVWDSELDVVIQWSELHL